MKDPKVQRLDYKIEGSKYLTYDDPSELDFENDSGHFFTAAGILSIEPNAHFVRESEARSSIEPFLEAWKASSNLESQSTGTINFKFLKSEIIDLNPPLPGESQTIFLEAGEYITAFGEVSFHLTRKTFPVPRAGFDLTPDTESAYLRWLGYKAGQEPLQSMAYFVLTVLEASGGRNQRNQACIEYQIDKAVLSEIGRLTSTKGSMLTARKATSSGDLTGAEKAWLEKAISVVVLRLGEKAGGGSLRSITMMDI